MKKVILTLIIAATLSLIIVEAQEKQISAGISQVTVFRQGAQIYGEVPLTLQPGTLDLVAGGLSPYIDVNSIQVKGEGDFMILGVNHRNNYLENPGESGRIAELRSKIEALKIKIEDEKTAVDVLREKELFLKSNYDVVTNKTAITSEQLKSFLDLYSVNIESVKFAMLKKSRLIQDYEKEKQALENQLASSVDRSKLPTGEIVVSVTNTKPITGKLKLSYVVMNAGWVPSYDIRVDDISAPASIIYKANIWQNSGVDWKEVKVSLSNASPMTAGALPALNPWFIDFYSSPVLYETVRIRGMASMPAKMNKKAEADMMMDAESAPLPVSVSESTISFSFDINIPQTVTSGGKPEIVELQRLTVPASYIYESVPKLNSSAYLVGNITGWEKYNLLPGESNIYFNNTFTGKGYINTSELTDTLPVSLGSDNNITIKRERRVDFTSQKLIGANRIETKSFLISVRNNKKQPVDIRLHDQIPLSQNSSIEVSAAELSGGNLDPVTGKIRWDLKIAPRETKSIILTYSVKYPKNQKVILE
ncbi:MAG TPA: DUF4139 domain-containing protein [Bacteroidales bacterium]|nr:DUF4139 domain-containing protein [Bacteroidales bacterium]